MYHMFCTKRKNPPKVLQRARKSPNYQYLVLCVYQLMEAKGQGRRCCGYVTVHV
jgi:hypothetical protein